MSTAEREPGLHHAKMVKAEYLAEWWQARRKAGQRLVFTNGCYDILHPGHVDLLARARALGDALVLGLNSDSSVQRQNKGPGRPYNSFAARAFVLSHLESVDFVVAFEEDTPLNLITLLRPDILVKGGDWSLDKVVGREVVEQGGGKVYSLPLLSGYSTTGLAERILAAGAATYQWSVQRSGNE